MTDSSGLAIQTFSSARAARHRLVAGLLLVPCAAVLLIAVTLEPNPAGMGTHQQMGLPPCGFLAATGLPCATCGMTTAFSHTVRGQFIAAIVTQPAGAMLALLTAIATITFAYAAVTGACLTPLGRTLVQPRTILLLTALIVLGWTYTLAATLLF